MFHFSSITRISFLLLALLACAPSEAALTTFSSQVNQNIIQAREKQSRFLIGQSRLASRVSGTNTRVTPLQSMSLQQAEARQIRLNAENQLQRIRSSFPSPVVPSPISSIPASSAPPAGEPESSGDSSLQDIHKLQSLYNQEQIAYYESLAEQENKKS